MKRGQFYPVSGAYGCIRAIWTGEFRPPKSGEYYLSGAIVEAYQAPNDLRSPHHIAKIIAPGDPPCNDERAASAFVAMRAFISQTSCDEDNALCDLLANLMHWANLAGADFDDKLRIARMHYVAEQIGAELEEELTEERKSQRKK